MVGADLADEAKASAFIALKRKVPKVDDIPRAREAFQDAAVVYAANKYGLDVAVFVPAFMNLKGDEKIGGKGLPMRTMRDLVHKTRNRWMGYYKKYLLEGVTDSRVAGATKKKRATKGAVIVGKAENKPVDTTELNQAPETTPLKRAIENITSIPRLVLKDTLPSQCSEGLRQEIEIAALQLVELLSKIK
jgi:hypothetical protein